MTGETPPPTDSSGTPSPAGGAKDPDVGPGVWAWLVLGLAFAGPVWAFELLPVQDLPAHEQIVSVLRHGPEWTGCGDRLRIDPTPRPYAVTYFMWAAVAALTSLSVATRLLLTWVIVGWLVCASSLVRACRPDLGWRSLLVGLYVFHEFYFLGLIPFLAGLPVGFWLIRRWALRRRSDAEASPKALAADGGLLLVAYLIHPGAGLVTGLGLWPWVAAGPRRGRRLRELLWVGSPSLIWTGALALFAEPYHHRYPVMALSWNSVEGMLLGLVSLPVSAYGSVFFWRGAGPVALVGWLALAGWLLGGVALGWGAAAGEAASDPPSRLRPVLRWGLVISLGYYVLFPYAFDVGSLLSLRVLPLLLVWLLACAPSRREGRATRLAVVLALASTACASWLAHGLGARELRPLEPVLAALEPRQAVIPPGLPGRSRVIRGAKLRALAHAPLRYHARRGGLGSTGLIHFTFSPVVVVAPLPDPAEQPAAYRYFVSLDGEGPPPGFVRVPLRGTGRWALYERSPRAAQGR